MFYFLYLLATMLKPGTGGGYAGSGRSNPITTLLEPDQANASASDIERIVLNWLDNHKIIDYSFQSSLMGGHYELGGAVVDFLFPDRELAWRIQGDYWHKQIAKQATDDIQRELLEGQGWIVVDVWGKDLDTPERVNDTLTKALRGEEVL